jgi:hypothetical protein
MAKKKKTEVDVRMVNRGRIMTSGQGALAKSPSNLKAIAA